MSKSLGNIVDPLDLIDDYGIDSVRYYLMREMVLGQDANFTLDTFIKRFNSDLANDFGNLLNRVSGLTDKLFDGCVPDAGQSTSSENDIQESVVQLDNNVKSLVSQLRLNEAIDEALKLVRQVNKYLESQAPWKVAKTDMARSGTILYTATEALRIAAVHLMPVMPKKCDSVLEVLGNKDINTQWGGLKPGTKLQNHEALFPRLEVEKK